MLAFFAIFRPLRGIENLQKYFYLVDEVLSFDLVDHMWKSIKNWLQEWIFSQQHFPQDFPSWMFIG